MNLAEYERREVALHTKDGYTLEGVLLVAGEECFVLTAVTRTDSDPHMQLGGEVVVPTRNVSFFQAVVRVADAA